MSQPTEPQSVPPTTPPIVWRRRVTRVVVPPDLAGRLHGRLREWFAHDETIDVTVDRRAGDERRRRGMVLPVGRERRQADRRSGSQTGGESHKQATVSVEEAGLHLPRAAAGHAARLRVVVEQVPVSRREAVAEDEALAGRARAGDDAAFDTLQLRHYNRVYAAIRAVEHVGDGRAHATTQKVFAALRERMQAPLAEGQKPPTLEELMAEVTRSTPARRI